MKNGCSACEKLPDDKMCEYCALGMLQATAEAAVRDYINKVNKVVGKMIKNKQSKTIIDDFAELLWKHSYQLSQRISTDDSDIYKFSASTKPEIEIKIQRDKK